LAEKRNIKQVKELQEVGEKKREEKRGDRM
jgi:hypothetical protein